MTTEGTRIVLRVLTAAGDPGNPVVDHPGQPADYVHTDGTVWTWQLKDGVHLMAVSTCACTTW